MEQNRIWILKSKGAESSFGGNEGYEDQTESHYIYDTTVKNYNKVLKDDLVIISDKKYILGFGKIERIDEVKGVAKKRFRCPVCDIQEHYERKNITPKYKCRNKHLFDTPVIEDITVDQYAAFYGESYVAAPPGMSAKLLDEHYIRRNRYYSIQMASSDFFKAHFPEFFQKFISLQSTSTVNEPDPEYIELPEYTPTNVDARNSRFSRIITREGQQAFRNQLISVYGVGCMITECAIEVAIEASHIFPYKGKKDNHPANGLLLRKDLHALFDSNLLGIEPETLKVYLHSSLRNSYYEKFEGQRLILTANNICPSRLALEIRWNMFRSKDHIK